MTWSCTTSNFEETGE